MSSLATIALLVCALVNVVASEIISVNWTREGVAQYDINNPLWVTLGDTLRLVCVNNDFSNVWLLTEPSQYENCSCTAMGNTCVEERQFVSCLSVIGEVLLQINENPLDLARVFSYRPGETYYAASFESGEQGGGPCLPTSTEPGVRMALTVFAPSTAPNTTLSTAPSTELDTETGPDLTEANGMAGNSIMAVILVSMPLIAISL